METKKKEYGTLRVRRSQVSHAFKKQAMKTKALQNHIKLQQLESRLTKYAYLSKQALPGAADALIFQKLKQSHRIPNKEIYENFFHWFVTIAQFASRQIESWKTKKSEELNDKLISECLVLIDSTKQSDQKSSQMSVQYIMNIFVKNPFEENMMIVKNKLLIFEAKQIGQQLKISFKNHQQRIRQHAQISDQLRVMFRLKPNSCQKFQELVLKWPQVENIQVRKQMKQNKA